MKNRNNFIITGILFAVFVLFTVLVMTVDVQPIGPEHSAVGLAGINAAVHEGIGVHLMWYKITEVCGVLAILTVLGFGLLGLIQLIQRKSLLKVDSDILALGGYYVIVAAFYGFFEVFIVNYRPVIMDEGLEASFPSSHSMIVICFIAVAMIQFRKRIKNQTVRTIAEIVSAVIIVFTVVGRLISGVHWFTDILAGVLLGCALVMLYYSVYAMLESQKKN